MTQQQQQQRTDPNPNWRTDLAEAEAAEADQRRSAALAAAAPALRQQRDAERHQEWQTRQREDLQAQATALRQRRRDLAQGRPALLAACVAPVTALAENVRQGQAVDAALVEILLQLDGLAFAEELERGRQEAVRTGAPTDDRTLIYRFTTPRQTDLGARGRGLLGQFDPGFSVWGDADLTDPASRAIGAVALDLAAPTVVNIRSQQRPWRS